jgi:Tfp pilus assembly protein PilX
MKQELLPKRHQGIVLLQAMILMIMLFLIAIASFNMGRQNTIIAGNMQHKAEVLTAANQAVEQVISTTTFIDSPDAALPGNTVSYDVNGDGNNDITVKLDPKPCVKKAQTIKNSELDLTNLNDVACTLGQGQNLGVEGATTGNSLCADSIWEINAVAEDEATGGQIEVTTGVGVRISADNAENVANICP